MMAASISRETGRACMLKMECLVRFILATKRQALLSVAAIHHSPPTRSHAFQPGIQPDAAVQAGLFAED